MKKINTTKNTNKKSKARGKAKEFPAIYRYDIRLNETDSVQFENMFDLSGYKYRGHFIRDKVLNTPLKVKVINKSLSDYIILLSQYRSQIRGIANNYNQFLRLLKEKLGERKALAFLYKLGKITIRLFHI